MVVSISKYSVFLEIQTQKFDHNVMNAIMSNDQIKVIMLNYIMKIFILQIEIIRHMTT